jgi:hypothetical protein
MEQNTGMYSTILLLTIIMLCRAFHLATTSASIEISAT